MLFLPTCTKHHLQLAWERETLRQAHRCEGIQVILLVHGFNRSRASVLLSGIRDRHCVSRRRKDPSRTGYYGTPSGLQPILCDLTS